MQPVEDLRERAELEPVELHVLPGRELAVAAAEAVRDLADRAQAGRRDAPAGELDPEHERPDLRLVVVEPPPLHPHDVLLGDAVVAGGDQRGKLVQDPERALVALDPLDRVPFVDKLPVRLRFQGAAACGSAGHARADSNEGTSKSKVASVLEVLAVTAVPEPCAVDSPRVGVPPVRQGESRGIPVLRLLHGAAHRGRPGPRAAQDSDRPLLRRHRLDRAGRAPRSRGAARRCSHGISSG